jgi:hypothetical protein
VLKLARFSRGASSHGESGTEKSECPLVTKKFCIHSRKTDEVLGILTFKIKPLKVIHSSPGKFWWETVMMAFSKFFNMNPKLKRYPEFVRWEQDETTSAARDLTFQPEGVTGKTV